MNRLHRWAALLLVLLLAATSLLIGAGTALAVDCSTEETIFWADEPSLSFRTTAYGTLNDIRFSDRDLITNCAGTSLAWSTAHISLAGIRGDWVEVGWDSTRVFVGGVKIHHWFSEWGVIGNTHGGSSGTYPCQAQNGNFHRWIVTNIPGTNNWNLRQLSRNRRDHAGLA
jgi:hypothetical protein